MTGCSCAAGYKGTITPTTFFPYYSDDCTPILCPTFSSGHTVLEGCFFHNNTSPGDYCLLIPSASSPYYSTFCTQFESCNALLKQDIFPRPFGTTNGVYYISYPDGVFPAFCDQVSDGGGWEMVFKISTSAGPLWSYNSSLWNEATSFNTSSLDESDEDALFPQYMNGNYSQVSHARDENRLTCCMCYI